MIDPHKHTIHATTTTFYVTILTTALFGYGLVIAYAWAGLPARPVIFALYTLLALLGAALLCLYRQALIHLCGEQAEEEEAEAIQWIRDAMLLDHEVDGLPRLVVLDGQHGVWVLTPDDPDYPDVADHVVRLCPQVASLLRSADAASASHEEDSDSDDDGGQSSQPQTARS